ncbi:MAG: DUF4129 domain-containing protein [Myxococcota bacterium]|jgi:hypothetical protein
MSVDALDLKPRGPVALFDAAIRVCATSSGVWALTLPAGAALVAAVFSAVEAARRGEPLAGPAAVLTAAWAWRAVSQGAACHYLEQQLLGPGEPSTRRSFLAGFKRAPSLVTTAFVVAALNLVLWLFTAGIGFFFFGAQAAAYATAMRGEGGALRVYGTASKLLGPARHTAAWVRLCGLTQLLVGLNLHLFIALLLYLGRSVLGLDLVFVDRFASLDNPTWLATVAAITFALYEPLRAATGTLLLIDGRVRQEGLDLVAAVEQLPRRRRPKGVPLSAAVLLALLLPGAAKASALRDRVDRLLVSCSLGEELDTRPFDAAGPSDQAALTRFVSRVERRAYDEEDCDGAVEELATGLRLMKDAPAASETDSAVSRDAAKAILARPEFQQAPVRPKEDTAEEDESPSWFRKLWDDIWKAIWEWLRRREPREAPIDLPDGGGSMAGANVVMLVAIASVAGVLLSILLRNWKRKRPADAAVDESGAVSETALSSDPMSALSRPPESWAGLADQLAAAGNFREAIRHLYLALLSRLHRDGAIDYDPTLSNWEYLSAFKGPGELKPAFRELTRRFDFVWYGNLDATATSYAVFRQTAGPLLTPRPEGADRA